MEPRIRVATAEDAPAIRTIYAPVVETTPISFEVEPPTVAEVADRIETTTGRYPWLVCDVDGEVLGYASAGSVRERPPYAWAVELSVYVAADARRSGVGTALYDSLLRVLERQGFYDAYAVTTVPNPPSVRLHERMGFDRVGRFPAAGFKQGDWHDVEWWHRRLAERPADPDPPTPLPELRGTQKLAAALRVGESHVER